jgi:hypothetical protein
MNLFLTSSCNERCAFCYADTFFERADRLARPEAIAALRGHLRTYADLVSRGAPLPEYSPQLDEETLTLFSSRTVNLLGGEPTLHPAFGELVTDIAGLGLGVMVFTNASQPARINAVKEHLWSVVLNGHFAERARDLEIEPMRIHANLPLQPGHAVGPILTKIHEAGIRTLYLAFAAPSPSGEGAHFTPDDLQAMRAMQEEAVEFCAAHEIFLAYDCSFPVCVDERVLQTKCTSVPVMDTEGYLTICGGEYFYDQGKRHISTFADYREIHAFTYGLISGMRSLPSKFEVCNDCEHFNQRCHGMCLAFREKPVEGSLPLPATRSLPLAAE